MSHLKITTWNLYQFAEPGIHWYEGNQLMGYRPQEWEEKKNWMARTVKKINADVIGCQEIFSVEAFKNFMQQQGYPHVAVVETPIIEQQEQRIYRTSVTGLASRYPFTTQPQPLSYPQPAREQTHLQNDMSFRRDVVRAEIDVLDLGNLVVYVCHFKSPGVFLNHDRIVAQPDWKHRFQNHFQQRAIKDADQLIQRTSDALGVYLAAMEEVKKVPEKPIVVLGDMNDTPLSPTLRVLTQEQEVTHIVRQSVSAIEAESDRAWGDHWRLHDAYKLCENASAKTASNKRQGTHNLGSGPINLH